MMRFTICVILSGESGAKGRFNLPDHFLLID